MSTATKLEYLNDTKQLLKENINSLGGNLTNEPFRQYASVLEGIYERLPKVSGIGSSLSLSPTMIGKIKLNEIQGDTLQDGTPTPDTPIPIENVTGLQNVTISNSDSSSSNIYEVNLGKNLFDENYTGITSDLTYKPIYVGDGAFILSTTAPMNTTGGANLFFLSGNVNSGASTGANGVYTNRPIQKQSENGYVTIAYRNTLGVNPEDYDTQLEKGSQATSYSPYFEPIELNKIGDYQDSIKKSTGKNLFDKDNVNILNAYFNVNGVISNNDTRSFYIPCKPNTTYTIQKNGSARFRIGTTETIPENGVSVANYVANDNDTPIIITTSSTAKYIICYFYATFDTNTKTLEQVLDTIQIEENSQATTYEPYGKVWYVEKNIEKLILDGSETYETAGTNTSGKYKIRYAGVVDLIKRPASAGTTADIISNQFIPTYANNTYRCNQGISVETNGKISFYDETLTQSTNAFTTWLESNNMTIYYALNTPTYTKITNEELINQLEELYTARSYEGTTNINVSSENLPMIINASALKGED
jgi:hypothetical protein